MRLNVLALAVLTTVASFTLHTRAEPVAPRVVAPEEGHKHGEHEKKKLGRQKIGEYTVSVIMIGDTHHDKEIEFDVKLIDAAADPKALHIWIGTEDGAGSEKAALVKKKTTFGASAKVPTPLPAGAKVWVQVETEAAKQQGSYVIVDSHKH